MEKLDVEILARKYAQRDRDFSRFLISGTVLGTDGVKKFARYLKDTERGEPLDFRDSTWTDFRAAGLALGGADFTGSVMRRVQFYVCRLDHAKLCGLLCDEFVLFGCSMIGTIIEDNADSAGSLIPLVIRESEIVRASWRGPDMAVSPRLLSEMPSISELRHRSLSEAESYERTIREMAADARLGNLISECSERGMTPYEYMELRAELAEKDAESEEFVDVDWESAYKRIVPLRPLTRPARR